MKVILCGFDGLRPDFITEETMPRLHAFLRRGVRCTDHRAVYPTETYVNHPTILTGCLPDRHGLVANVFYDYETTKERYYVGSSVERIEEVESATAGGLFRVPTLTNILSGASFSVLTISSNTAGSTRLLAHDAAKTGAVNISVHGLRYALPETLRTAYGRDPDDDFFEKPDIWGLRKINELLGDIAGRGGLPDISILWYGEPDHSFHEFGIGSAESLSAVRHADLCFGEILDRYGQEDEVQIIAVSDHGHLTITRKTCVGDLLASAGFIRGDTPLAEGSDFSILWGYNGTIYVRNRDRIPAIVEALQSFDEIGMIFTPDRDGVQGAIPGTFSMRLVGGEHARAGDIRYILDNTDQRSKLSFPGTCVFEGPLAPGSSIHGGLNASEVSCLLGMCGSAFKQDCLIRGVTGAIDIAPTILALFGIIPRTRMQGRILAETLRESPENGPDSICRHFETGMGDYRQFLDVDYIGSIPYFRRGGRLRSTDDEARSLG